MKIKIVVDWVKAGHRWDSKPIDVILDEGETLAEHIKLCLNETPLVFLHENGDYVAISSAILEESIVYVEILESKEEPKKEEKSPELPQESPE